MQKFYQLCVQLQTADDYTSTVYHSRLYASKEQCREDCLTVELVGIAEKMCEEGSEEVPEPFESLRAAYESSNDEAIKIVKSIKAWLEGSSGRWYAGILYGPSVYWEIVSYAVAESTDVSAQQIS